MGPQLALEEIYDAALDEEAFTWLLQQIAQAIGARSFVAGWHFHDQTATMFRHSGRWSDEQMADYNRRFAFTDIWNVAHIRNWRPNRARDLAELVPDWNYEKSILYNEFFRAQGDDTYRAVAIPTGNRFGIGAMAFHRGKSQAPFDANAVGFLDEHAIHLGRLLALRGRLSGLERVVDCTSSVLDALGQAIFLVNGAGGLLHANAAGQEMLNGSGGLVLRRGGLSAVSPPAALALKDAITKAVLPVAPAASAIVIPCSGGASLNVSVIAVPSSTGRRNVLVTAIGVDRRDETVEGRLRGLYGLSPGEARVAAMLAQGRSPTQIAEERGVAITTVRTQIKAIADKLGCRRQADIVRNVKNLPPLHGLSL